MALDEIVNDITPPITPDTSLITASNPVDQPYEALSDETRFDDFLQADSSEQLSGESSGLLSTSFETEIPYTYYGFLCLRGSYKLDCDQRDFLEKSGCFQVPTPAILDMILPQYFNHVQPYLPLIDECSFWEAYSLKVDRGKNSGPICLFVFNAMMAACSPYLTLDIIKKAGWRDNRTTRNMFYRRAQLLFNFDIVDDPLSIAMGSVLLAEQCSSSNNHAGCHWLDIALHHARLIGAHKCDGELELRTGDALCKKRLWWCILIRDMVLSIGLRIQAKINRIHFKLSSPAMKDLQDYTRVLSSRTFSSQIKHALSQIFGLQCRLAIITSEISTFVYGPTAEIQAEELSMTEFQQIISDLNRCKADLDCWMNDAGPVITFQSAENQSPAVLTAFKHVVFIQHYMIRLALCQREMFVLKMKRYYLGSCNYVQELVGINETLERSINSICSGIHGLAAGTNKHLPIGILCFSALPLILGSLDTKLPQTELQIAASRRREKYLHEALEMLLIRYDITDDITQYIRKIKSFVHNKDGIGFAQAEYRSRSHSVSSLEAKALIKWRSTNTVTTWCEVFLFDPQVYLRLSKLLDYTLSHQRFPHDDEISALFSRLRIAVPGQAEISDAEPWLGLEETPLRDGSNDEPYPFHRRIFLPTLETRYGYSDEASGSEVDMIGRRLSSDCDDTSYWYDDMVEALWDTLGIPGSFSAFVD
ncbi:hypothetical protein EG329_001784 [Mollisiaceae sp. DMI_Dod_QoI]|nr:hypothetical protein EG329_001784 [Helotiales sp. DMI_Dod_QoI]